MTLFSIKSGLFAISVGIAAVVFCGLRHTASGQEKGPVPVQIQMRNVNFRLARDIVLEVRALRGQLERAKADVPVTFDDPASFTVNISSAQVAISPASLTALINSYVLAYEGAPIKKVTVTLDGNKVVQKGTLHKGIDLPFEIEGTLSASEDGNIRLHADKIKGAHLPVKGLLHLFGEDLSKLMKQNEARGMKIVGDDIIMLPNSMTPPPHMIGRVTKVSIADGKIVQTFDSGRRDPELTPPFRASAYLYHRGGILRFGKLTMSDADLEIVGDRPGVFDFFQKEYKKQLIAGYSKNTPDNGLVSHMVDYSRFASRPQRAGESRTTPAVTQTRR
jgi:hypothetical protein